ncbi:MAG TPA: hypothetical protein VG839_07945 [Asticcacaulis sp.]|nr:hypothetical protein [Asticcacaulis sp.]
MHKFLPAAAIVLSMGLASTHAFADCDDTQEQAVGKALAAASAAKIAGIVPSPGKQMVSLDACDADSGKVSAEFKYNVIGADGLYWAQGRAKVVGGAVQDIKFTSLSPNLAAGAAKSGVKLAAN